MTTRSLLRSCAIRTQFAEALSSMYRQEVPAYGTLVDTVTAVNAEVLSAEHTTDHASPTRDQSLGRLSSERHGAIRLGTAAELSLIRRAFAVMGMQPVGYYDLSVAGIPVHSCAFRPVSAAALANNPFRVFTSLLRLPLIREATLRAEAEALLASRRIINPEAQGLIERAEQQGGLSESEAAEFIAQLLQTFRWHQHARVSLETYQRLHQAHGLIADVVSFQGPHINHLTPRTLDIDACQQRMLEAGLPAKAVIEGPPARRCPILLRQTSFKALEEPVLFVAADAAADTPVLASHTARFGEIEQRGVALTPKGRALYDQSLAQAREQAPPNAPGGNGQAYQQALERAFAAFPDDWLELHRQGLAYFSYRLGEQPARYRAELSLQALLDQDVLRLVPIVYEDFLPVSAAGIFQSNLAGMETEQYDTGAQQAEFEQALGAPVLDPMALYAEEQSESLRACRQQLALMQTGSEPR